VRFYGVSIRYGNFLTKKGQVPAEITLERKIEAYTFFLIFDFHHRTLEQMIDNDMIIDNFQIGQIVLQLLHLINFLHTHQEPRALGSVRVNEVFWPFKVVLPYLRSCDEAKREDYISEKGFFSSLGEGFEGDVKVAGQLLKSLLETGEENPRDAEDIDDHFGEILRQMVKESKYERITLSKCITNLEELLLITIPP
jgi:hypothetical protein